jgi:hypothetical protein
MSAPACLPNFAYIPPIAEQSCTAVFNDARNALTPLRQFSAKAMAAFEQMTRHLATDDAGFTMSRDESARAGIYFKARSVFTDGRLTSLAKLREIVAAHIAWDMGLPHVVYGVTRVPFQAEPVVYTLAPRRDCYDYGLLSGDNNFETLCQSKSHLLPTFLALTVLDTALIANDRHANNLLYLPATVVAPEALVGIDLDHNNWHFSHFHPDNKLYVRPEVRRALRQVEIDAPSLALVRATLTAFETYPACRAERIARRLTPIAPVIWNPAEIADSLRARQLRVRENYARMLKPAYQASVLAT